MMRLSALALVGALAGGRYLSAHSTAIVADVVAPFDASAIDAAATPPDGQESVRNIRDLVGAVRNLPPVVCGLTAEAAAGWGGGRLLGAPVPPLGAETAERVAWFPRGRLLLSEVAFLIDSLGATDACVREVAVRMLGRMDAPLVEGRLIERLTASTPAPTREAATIVLGLVQSKSAVEPLLRLVNGDEPAARANAVWALGRIGDKSVARSLRPTLGDRDELVRVAAAGALGRLEDADSIDDLVQVLRNDRSRRVRRVAAWALGTMEAKRAAPALSTALRAEQERDVREMIVWALGSMEDRAAVPALVEALRRDASEEVREGAAWALGSIEDESAASALGEAAGGDASDDVRGTAAWALGQLELREPPAGLVKAVGDASAEVRTKAAWALSEIADDRALDARTLDAVRGALRKETNKRARKAELRALMRGGERSEAFYKELLTSEDAEVREEAVKGMAGRGMNPWPWPMPRPRPFP